jgi:hypothetical protein
MNTKNKKGKINRKTEKKNKTVKPGEIRTGKQTVKTTEIQTGMFLNVPKTTSITWVLVVNLGLGIRELP